VDSLKSKLTVSLIRANVFLNFLFYRAMLHRARLCHSKSSVRTSVTFRCVFHTGCNTSKIILQLISLRFLLGLTPTWAIWSNGNTLKIRVDRPVGSWAQKPIESRIYAQSHTCFRLLAWFWSCAMIFGYRRDFASRPWKSAYSLQCIISSFWTVTDVHKKAVLWQRIRTMPL